MAGVDHERLDVVHDVAHGLVVLLSELGRDRAAERIPRTVEDVGVGIVDHESGEGVGERLHLRRRCLEVIQDRLRNRQGFDAEVHGSLLQARSMCVEVVSIPGRGIALSVGWASLPGLSSIWAMAAASLHAPSSMTRCAITCHSGSPSLSWICAMSVWAMARSVGLVMGLSSRFRSREKAGALQWARM